MLDFCGGYDFEFYGHLSPNPTAVPTYLSIIRPLQPVVWLLIVIALVIVGVVIKYVSLVENDLTGRVTKTKSWMDHVSTILF